MKIAEIYNSIQGEGFLTGTRSTFVRASGCNLRCWFCDTPYTSWEPEGNNLEVEEILRRVEELDGSHVVLTGGEPMLFAQSVELCRELHAAGRHITIETAGTVYQPLTCDLMSISPKLASSAPSPRQHPQWNRRHQRTRHAPEVIRRLIDEHPYQIKFVVDSLQDCEAVQAYLDELSQFDRARVMLMPQGTDVEGLANVAQWLVPYCQAHDLHFCPRMQIEWFGQVRGT